jgi:hypothetical protein
MFGLFESDEKKVMRLFKEFRSYADWIAKLPEKDRDTMTTTLGGMLKEMEKTIAHPLTVGGDDALAMAKLMRKSAKGFAPEVAICYKMIASITEASSVNHPIVKEFRAGAEQFFLGAQYDYECYLERKKK